MLVKVNIPILNTLSVLSLTDPALVDDDGDGFSEVEGDCDDSNASINPEAEEICDDGIDQDCSGADLT